MNPEKIVFAAQGNRYSWHAEAARQAAGTEDIGIVDCEDFGEVITACIDYYPGLGCIAINTAAGTVEKSAKRIVGRRSAALPHVVARVDLTIGLALIGSSGQSIEDLNRRGVTCYLQPEAQLQIDDFKRHNLPLLHYEKRKESTHAVQEALEKNSPDHVAVGPSYSARMMGGFVIGPEQINPEGSVTSFYVMQRDPREQILPVDPNKSSRVTVLCINYPEKSGEIERWLDALDQVGVEPIRYIPYRTGEPTRHDPSITKNGGILEVRHDLFDPKIPKFCAKVNSIKGGDGFDGPFDAKKIGGYDWFEEEVMDLNDLLKDQMV